MDDLRKITYEFDEWLKKEYPNVRKEIEQSNKTGCGLTIDQCIDQMPICYWGDVGRPSYEVLTNRCGNESILDRVISIVKDARPTVRNDILVGFVEAHMFPRPESPLAKEMSDALGMNLVDEIPDDSDS